MGFSPRGYPARFRARLRRASAWPTLWSVRSRDPPPDPKVERQLSWGSLPLRHLPARRIRYSRGSLPPAPSALRVWLPSRRLPLLHAWRRPVDRRSAHGVRPSGPCSPPPAVPLSRPRLSCRSSSPPEGGWSRLQRLAPAEEGPDSPPPEGGDGRTLPSWDPAPPRLSPPTTFGPASRTCSLLACCWGCSLRTTPSPGYRGSSVAEAAWSLMRLPAFLGFGTLSNAGPLRATLAPGLSLRLGLRTLVSGNLLGAPDCPTGVQLRAVSVRRFVLTPNTDFLSQITQPFVPDCRTVPS